METALDGFQVSPLAENGAGGHALAAIEPLEGGGAVLAELARAVEHDLSTPDYAPATERAYAHDWADFAAFCGRHGLAPLPAAPQTLALYLKALETQRSRSPAGLAAGTVGLSLPTLRRRLAAIASRHAIAGLETPTDHPLVRKLLRRYSRSRGTVAKKKEPLLIERLPTLLMAMPDDLAATRDRALLLLGYAGAFRRAELVALDAEQLRFRRRDYMCGSRPRRTTSGRRGASYTCRGCRRGFRTPRCARLQRLNAGWPLWARPDRSSGPSICVVG